MKIHLAALYVLLCAIPSHAQKNDTLHRSPVTFSGYAELFYKYDFSNPEKRAKQPFLYNYNRHNQVNLNFATLRAHYEHPNVRANLGLMAGTYAQDNLAAEKEILRTVYEANAGVRLAKNEELWLDAGIMPSHIGWESAIGKDNLTVTRSLAAENSPYFETGAKVSYTSPNKKWMLSALVVNGWQRITRAEGNTSVCFGHQLTYSPSEKITLNSSSFIGNDKPETEKRVRYFHDVYAIVRPNAHWEAIIGFDIGAEEATTAAKKYNVWYTPAILAKYKFSTAAAVAGRIEYFSDPNGVIISTNEKPFQTLGVSLNFDYTIYKNVLWRVEWRRFSARDALFLTAETPQHRNSFITTSLSAWF